jgi:alcohol dehydrogenase (cytochrome c)
LWVNRWEPRGSEPLSTQRGVAFADGRIVRGTADGYLLALDVKDGHTLWARSIADPRQGYFISMPPLIKHGLVYVGPAGAELGSSGWVGAFRLGDGEEVWRFHIVPLDGEPGAETWGTDPGVRKHAGGNLWTALSFDEERQLLYVPGGNPTPDFYDVARSGDNLYTNSLIALDAKTGGLRWYKQLIAHDVRDYDLTHVSPVIRVRGRTLIVTTGKDGVLRAVDAATHEIVYAKPFTTLLNNEGPIGTRPVRTCPGVLGGNEWNGAAYSSRLRLIFAPATDWCADISRDDTPPDPEGEHSNGYFGGKFRFDPWDRARGWLTAFEAASGETRWRYAAAKPIIGAVTATAGDIVLTGELAGDFVVLDARTGRVLVRRNIGAPIAGGIVTYAIHGAQAVAVVSGYVGVYNQIAPEIGGGNPTVTVFRVSK